MRHRHADGARPNGGVVHDKTAGQHKCSKKLSERDRCFVRSSAPPCRATSQG
jgi:hypothetical protein